MRSSSPRSCSKNDALAFIEAASAGFEDGGGDAGFFDGGERALPIFRRGFPGLDRGHGFEKSGYAGVSVRGLPGEFSARVGGIAHEERVGRSVAVLVGGEFVASVGLVDADFAIVMESEESLLGVDFAFGGDPG